MGVVSRNTPSRLHLRCHLPAEIDGDTARVNVTRTAADETSETVVVELRQTDHGWRVSGASLDPLVTYLVQRLQEKY